MLLRDLECVLPRAARISVLGIPRRGWRGFESPAKFKLLAMEGVRCLGAWGGRKRRWTCLHHRTGAWVMHFENRLPQIAEWEMRSMSESFRNPMLGVCAMVYHPMGHTHTDTGDLSLQPLEI